MTPHLEASPPAYVPRDPSQTLLYQVLADHPETFLASLDADPDAKGFPASDGTTGIRLSPVELLGKLAALVPLPRVHLVRYGGCLAPHSHLRGAIIPTTRQQGLEEQEDRTASPRWSWA
jgi:Putative transposase